MPRSSSKRAAWKAKVNAKQHKVALHQLDRLTNGAFEAGATFSDARRASTVGATTRFDESALSAAEMKEAIFAEEFNGMMGELKRNC